MFPQVGLRLRLIRPTETADPHELLSASHCRTPSHVPVQSSLASFSPCGRGSTVISHTSPLNHVPVRGPCSTSRPTPEGRRAQRTQRERRSRRDRRNRGDGITTPDGMNGVMVSMVLRGPEGGHLVPAQVVGHCTTTTTYARARISGPPWPGRSLGSRRPIEPRQPVQYETAGTISPSKPRRHAPPAGQCRAVFTSQRME